MFQVETLAKRYPCNPLWSQLCDLYGALGMPLKVTHTVIVGETEKSDLINTVLTFLSYFIRSGNIERRKERRCSPERELREAVILLKDLETKQRPYIIKTKRASNFDSFNEPNFSGEINDGNPSIRRKVSERRLDSTSSVSRTLKLKRSESTLQNLTAVTSDSVKPDINFTIKHKSFDYSDTEKIIGKEEKDQNSNSVKIIVSETLPLERHKRREYLQRSTPLNELENKIDDREFEDAYLDAKLESLARYQDNDFDSNKLFSNGIDGVDSSLLEGNQLGKEQNVRFVLGGEEKTTNINLHSQDKCYCQCYSTFPRVPSTSAQLPENVLRKIIQRNFPESSKSIEKTSSSSAKERSTGFCPNCFGESFATLHNYEGNSLLLETPTNATEVLRTCSNASSSVGNRGVRINRCNSLEYLMEANGVVELPMPRSKKVADSKSDEDQQAGLASSLQFGGVRNSSFHRKADTSNAALGYTWGLVAQGLSKRKKKKRRKKSPDNEGDEESEDEWLGCVRDEVEAAVHSSVVDLPVAEALCIVADVDSWQVGILSNNTSPLGPPLPVGMSRLVANMLEAFSYVWRKYQSPVHVSSSR